MNTQRQISTLLLAALLGVVFTAGLHAQSTAFTYQGRLNDGGSPASGIYDLRFTIYDSSNSPGTIVAGPTTNAAIEVDGGLFTVTLDFGPSVFDGNARWLEIGAATNGAGAFSTLSPRQEITSAPYALRATEATAVPTGAITGDMLADGAVTAAKISEGAVHQLGTPDGSDSSAVTVSDDGHVGVGTDDPAAGLHITASSTIQSLKLVSVLVDETAGLTDLRSAFSVAAEGDLLAVSGYFDNGITFLNVSNKSSPILRSQIRDGFAGFNDLFRVRGLAFSGELLAAAAELDNAVTLIRTTFPSEPTVLAVLRDGEDGFNELAGAQAVAIEGNLMAVAAINDDAVTLVDISDPSSPSFHVAIKDETFGFNELGGPVHVALSGNLLAVAARIDDAVTLIDVSNPSSPVLRSVMKDGINGFNQLAGAAHLAIQGNLLAIASTLDGAATLVDISDPSAPALLSVIKDGVGDFDFLGDSEGVALSGTRMAITAGFDDAVTLVDITDPTQPRLLGYALNHLAGVHHLENPQGVIFHGGDLIVAGYDSDAVSILRPGEKEVSLATSQWVGIGTQAPLAPLHVAGDLIVDHATEVNLETTHFSAGENTAATGVASTALGYRTTASADSSTAMGDRTTASGVFSTAMGRFTTASGEYSTAMGNGSAASGFAAVAMGQTSDASGIYTLAAGHNAKADHDGCFVWADSQDGDFASTANDQFAIRAANGVRIYNRGDDATLLQLDTDRAWEFRQLNSGPSSALELGTVSEGNPKNFIIKANAVGIDTESPGFKFQVNGSVAGVGAYNSLSDRRYKKDIQPLTNALETVQQLQGVSFDWRREEHPEMQFEERRQLGFVAQDLQRVVPEAVSKSKDGTLHAAYSEIIPLLVEAVKEQNERLERDNAELKARVETLEQLIQSLTR